MSTKGPILEELPLELLIKSFANLTLAELVPIRQSSKQMSGVAKHPYLLDDISQRALMDSITQIKEDAPHLSGMEIEEHLNVVWGNSFFETFKLTFQEYKRELQSLVTHPDIDATVKDSIAELIEALTNDSPEKIFYSANKFIELCNMNFCLFGSNVIFYTDANEYGLNISNQGLTRLPISLLAKKLNFPHPISSLCVRNNAIKHLPDTLWEFKALWCLELSNNELETISENLQKLSHLKRLDINKNNLTTILSANKAIIEKTSIGSIKTILESQKIKFTRALQLGEVAMRYFIYPLMLLKEFNEAHLTTNPTHDFMPTFIAELISFSLQIYILYGMLVCAKEVASYIIENNTAYSALPFREDMISHFCSSTQSKFSRDSKEARSYDIGRESARAWLPYLHSFASRDGYSKAYYAGIDDARNNIPSRIIGTHNFKEFARDKLGLS